MTRQPVSFLIVGANTPWVYLLGNALAGEHRTHVLRVYDWLTHRRVQPAWPRTPPAALLERGEVVLPPGYTSWLQGPAQAWLRRRVARECDTLAQRSGARPWVLVPYPWLEDAVRDVPGERLVYYNLDDYELYRPDRAARVRQAEDRFVARSHRTLCLSAYQVDQLRRRLPASGGRIRHFPLGVADEFLNPAPVELPDGEVIGYVGNLGDRVDWRFAGEVARRCADLTFEFVGALEASGAGVARAGWEEERDRVRGLPNVRFPGRIAQDDVGAAYRRYAITWIPYAVEHPFNRASCPTKIMDGLASGRPVLSTDLPECRVYPQWIDIAADANEAATRLRVQLAGPARDADRARRQVEFARSHTWPGRAARLLAELST